ncbi:MAG: hypothetical protein HOD97_04110 [Candidatus Marinimicrobia bacterium]|nr:hypothetical protein [Candidatus Neomarinimicrobiota bacterium]MBT3617904.1 hypothetical protein [Candidatus Neomarinimicrobiota bacterium]MBT3828741.1 hypothetical protein [Candidatus Neomarinimicrobiota bacterium]MBT3997032.1 hypothetical protein [Candidatus Neomarinimicrobiota bacterium]MBT4280788.1 hypothetical protein [Candidatus Neomarinimicrobiota bacterium]
MKNKLILLGAIFFITFSACNEPSSCDDCGGGIIGGYLYKKVTSSDLGQLGSVEGINLDSCIRYKLSNDDFDAETVTIVPDCCCDQYSL